MQLSKLSLILVRYGRQFTVQAKHSSNNLSTHYLVELQNLKNFITKKIFQGKITRPQNFFNPQKF